MDGLEMGKNLRDYSMGYLGIKVLVTENDYGFANLVRTQRSFTSFRMTMGQEFGGRGWTSSGVGIITWDVV